ncbi:MAG: hypothetical protein R3C52_04940 [Hyphomonadaceae bacterium]
MTEPSTDARHLTVKPRSLAMIVGGGLLAGALIVVGAIMPAEYNVDPLGIGKLSGLSRLWAPDENDFAAGGDLKLSSSSATPRHSHVVEIPLGAAGWDEEALEYKVHMTPGQAILFRWQTQTLDGKPLDKPVEVDMHGHDVVAEGEEEMTVVTYLKDEKLADQGSLTAPFEGIHGWYFRNRSEDPAIIRLEIEGFYDLIPPGQPGNEFRIRPIEQSDAP